MKKVLALILLVALGYFMVTGLIEAKQFQTYGNVSVSERVSQNYIDKNVTTDASEIIYKETANAETGSANYVTSIIANYRVFDTLGEVTVLFISALGIALLFGHGKKTFQFYESNFILRIGSKMIFGFILVVGIYIFMHGHLTPGGGFPGGAMIASSILMMYLADNKFKLNVKAFNMTESLSGSILLIIGLLGIPLSGYFFFNFMPTGVIGETISAGIIPIVYTLIGLKVGAELSGIISEFMVKGGE